MITTSQRQKDTYYTAEFKSCTHIREQCYGMNDYVNKK